MKETVKTYLANWRTTAPGVTALIYLVSAGILTPLSDGNPATNPDWNTVIPGIFLGLSALFSRQQNVSDEQSGAKK